jgi:hypothetical protein
MSKSYRLLEIAREIFAAASSVTIEELDLSRLSSEYGRNIYPCKVDLPRFGGQVSTIDQVI